jgi:hypothetical protein
MVRKTKDYFYFLDNCQRSSGFSFTRFQREATVKRYMRCLAGRHPDTVSRIGEIGQSLKFFLNVYFSTRHNTLRSADLPKAANFSF